ncbi:hypothetical protein [Gilvimarinus polysaccharolyticus]|uniref:hypothetical protein n=1 Tax=Gilvimarinus polysaccharolyticus TaxID=863921 RepID=UPI00067316A0|nr:hypothetical protein [Gilvimarinus polysaccharolyticus]
MTSTPISKQQLAALLPHAEPMILLDCITGWDADNIQCTATRHTQSDNPLRIEGVLSVFAGVEYAAQAMAAHARLCAPQQNAPARGFIAVASKLKALAQQLDESPGELHINARKLVQNNDSSLYEFCLSGPQGTILSGQITAVINHDEPAL